MKYKYAAYIVYHSLSFELMNLHIEKSFGFVEVREKLLGLMPLLRVY